MKKITVIVCNNGLGHLKRVLSVIEKINNLKEDEYFFSIFYDLKKGIYFKELINDLYKKKVIHTFNVEGNDEEYENNFLKNYKSILLNSDFVWSDNYIFPLKYRKNTLLTGSFLWLNVDNNKKRKKNSIELLKKTKPIMIGLNYFTTKNIRKYTNFVGVGIYEYYKFELNLNQNNILISFGKSPASKEIYAKNKKFIKDYILKNNLKINFFIDPDYFNDLKGLPGVNIADFSEDMYRKIGIAIIRPGIGTICSLLSKSGYIISIYEKNNCEIIRNAKILKKLNVGDKYNKIKIAFRKAEIYLNNLELQNKHKENIKKLNFNGLRDTALKIMEIIKNG